MIPLVDLQAEYTAMEPGIEGALKRVASSGRYILGSEVSDLESALGAYVRADPHARAVHCVGVSDGTAALQIALMALGVGAGHEVVVPPFTWISTVDVVCVVGATPVFCDVRPDGNIDPARLAEVLTARTRAVIAVSLFGLVAPMHALRTVLDGAESKSWTRIALIEDGAQSFGAVRGGVRSCASPYSTMATTSFFPTKPLGCLGDGGALFTTDEKLAAAAREIRVHGKRDGKFCRVGINSRLDALQAAVLGVKLARLDDSLCRRRVAAERYNDLLRGEPRVIPIHAHVKESELSHVWAIYTLRVRNRDAVVKLMKERGVGVAVYYPVCCHQQPMFKELLKRTSMPVAEALSKQVFALPLHPWIELETQKSVVRTLVQCLDELNINELPLPVVTDR